MQENIECCNSKTNRDEHSRPEKKMLNTEQANPS